MRDFNSSRHSENYKMTSRNNCDENNYDQRGLSPGERGDREELKAFKTVTSSVISLMGGYRVRHGVKIGFNGDGNDLEEVMKPLFDLVGNFELHPPIFFL
jgi:hypothetical protein